MVIIRESRSDELQEVSRILAPAFEDKVRAIIGDEEKALSIIPRIIRTIPGKVFVACTGEDRVPVGAIIISLGEFRISLSVAVRCIRVMGLSGSVRAFRMVGDYLRSEPEMLEGEGRLEAVGVDWEHRGTGIGRALVERGEGFLRERGMAHFGLGVKEDNPACRLYHKLGFRKVTRYHNKLGEWLYMRKAIGGTVNGSDTGTSNASDTGTGTDMGTITDSQIISNNAR